MADYTIPLARSAGKELEALRATIVARILLKIEALASEPRPHGAKQLRDKPALWRIGIVD